MYVSHYDVERGSGVANFRNLKIPPASVSHKQWLLPYVCEYISLSGQSSCELCEEGSYSNTLAATQCSSCLPGQYSDGSSTLSCKSCAPGTFTNTTGAQSCMECQPGEYQQQSGNCIILYIMYMCLIFSPMGNWTFGTGLWQELDKSLYWPVVCHVI